MSEELEQLVESARERLGEMLDWLNPILQERLYLISAECSCPLGVDEKGRVYFNEDALNQILQSQTAWEQKVEWAAFLWYHGVTHLLFNHAKRAREVGEDPNLWNLCADWEVADSVPEPLRHLNIWQELQVPPMQAFGVQQTAGMKAETLYEQLSPNQPNLTLDRDEGSGVHGHTRSWEERFGDYLEPKALRDIRIEVAILLFKHSGNVPRRWIEWRDSILREQADRIIHRGRQHACEHLPWFSSALLGARLVFDRNLPSPAAIDMYGRIYINPDKIIELLCDALQNLDLERRIARTVRQVAFLFYHEIAHWIREHWKRFEASDTSNLLRWNVATDLEINDDIPEGFEPIQSILTPQSYNLPNGRTAEWYLRNGREVLDKLVPDEGSGVHGQRRDWELDPEDPNHPAIRDLERSIIQRKVAHELEEYKKTQGEVPAGWQRWAEEILHPKVNWRERLKQVLRGAITQGYGERLDYSMSRPSRRTSVYQPFYLPSLRGRYEPYVYCVIDTSGSIHQKELTHALGEVKGLLEQMQIPIRVVPCDAVPYETVEVFTQSDLFKLAESLPGGGGTDMVAALEHLKTVRPKPDIVIVLTDGHTPYPAERTREFAVIWGLWKSSRQDPPRPLIPPWREDDIVLIPVED